jgi:hypothetical protein
LPCFRALGHDLQRHAIIPVQPDHAHEIKAESFGFGRYQRDKGFNVGQALLFKFCVLKWQYLSVPALCSASPLSVSQFRDDRHLESRAPICNRYFAYTLNDCKQHTCDNRYSEYLEQAPFQPEQQYCGQRR